MRVKSEVGEITSVAGTELYLPRPANIYPCTDTVLPALRIIIASNYTLHSGNSVKNNHTSICDLTWVCGWEGRRGGRGGREAMRGL